MPLDEEHAVFIALCSGLIDELSAAVEKGSAPVEYPNANLLLENLTAWRQLAEDGNLYHPARSSFGVSRSDLLFGKADERVRKLEEFYHHRIYRQLVGRPV